MVLQEEIPADSRSLYAAHPVYRESAAQLHSMPVKLVGPVGLLYVQQREMAATLPQDSKRNVSCLSDPLFVAAQFDKNAHTVHTHGDERVSRESYTNAPTIIVRNDLSEMKPTGKSGTDRKINLAIIGYMNDFYVIVQFIGIIVAKQSYGH